MNLQNFHYSISVPISASEAFEKINRVGDWCAVNFKGSAKNLHDRFTVHFARVTMTHIGLIPGIECYVDCSKGWSCYVGESLYKLFTENKGLPGSGIFADVIIADRRCEGLLFSKTEPFPDFADGYLVLDVRAGNQEYPTAGRPQKNCNGEK